jgi:uroporphyrin-III C-methyltransferase
MPHDLAQGRVLLVGAGPGPADLMTVRALRAVEGAQALLYDALVSDEVVALAPRGCIRIQTGKRAGRPSMRQSTINRLMLRLARRGLTVVRLKGGDPSVFGRSGEESLFLEGHGVPVDVVPGVTAASAAAAQFRLPLTHRGMSRRLTLATARLQDGAVSREIGGADTSGTLALYMGRDSFAEAARQLVAAGRAASTPAMAVENAGYPGARAIYGTLETLSERLTTAAPQGPTVILVGEVTALASSAPAQQRLASSMA